MAGAMIGTEENAMPGFRRRHALGTILLAGPLILLPGRGRAQVAGQARLRGTIASLAGAVLTVATREGPNVAVTLTEPLTVSALRRVALADITPGTSVGAVAEPGAEGELRAVAITVLPPGARIAERQIAWDLAPGTSMNDGPVEAVVQDSAGGLLTLGIHGRSVQVRVSRDTPLLMPVAAARADLVPGAAIFINATRGADGELSAGRVTVGKDGVVPAI